MDMDVYEWICEYGDILVLVYRYDEIDIGMMEGRGELIKVYR